MDPLLVNFILQSIGIPVVAEIIKAWKTAHNGTFPTSEEVISAFVDDWQKWVKQGNDWLAANK